MKGSTILAVGGGIAAVVLGGLAIIGYNEQKKEAEGVEEEVAPPMERTEANNFGLPADTPITAVGGRDIDDLGNLEDLIAKLPKVSYQKEWAHRDHPFFHLFEKPVERSCAVDTPELKAALVAMDNGYLVFWHTGQGDVRCFMFNDHRIVIFNDPVVAGTPGSQILEGCLTNM